VSMKIAEIYTGPKFARTQHIKALLLSSFVGKKRKMLMFENKYRRVCNIVFSTKEINIERSVILFFFFY